MTLKKWIPSPSDYPQNRLFCLDCLRGLDIFYLTVVSIAIVPLLKYCHASPALQRFLLDHPWEGFTLYDLIMPLFIFMAGAAVPLAFGRRIKDGRPLPGFHRHVWGRVALLWVLGMFVQGNLLTFDIHKISPYNNTLQTIAVGYAAAAYSLLLKNWIAKIAIPLALTAGYGLIVHFGGQGVGDYSQMTNATVPFELAILNSFLPADNYLTGKITGWGYTWFLPSMMFPVIGLAGCYSTQILLSKRTEYAKAALLAAIGAAVLAGGWIFTFCGVKMVKHIFTISFTWQAVGWSMLLLAALYVLTDIWKLRKGTGVLLLFGQFALTAYLCEGPFRGAAKAVSEGLLGGFASFFPKYLDAFVIEVGFGIVVIAVVAIRRRLKLADRA